jgi:hypothetical protein
MDKEARLKIALLKYSNTTNVGDNIQTLAVAQHVDQDYDLVDRDFLSLYDGEPVAVVMNGWFTHEPQNWPPAPKITPIFFGFHLAPQAAAEFGAHRDYFRRFAPIGCRDRATADIVRSWGVDAYVSGCATMTFPVRTSEPTEPKLILADQTHKHFLSRDRQGFIDVTHKLPIYLSTRSKFAAAREILEFYRDNAGMVITSRIHAAMPCAAMGIPVVYTGIREGRTEVVDMIGIRKADTRRFPRTRLAELPAEPLDFEDQKQRITADLHARLSTHGIKVRVPKE